MSTHRPTRVLFLDVVGTIIKGPDDEGGRWVNRPADVEAFPEAAALMARWKDEGGRIVTVSNQGGVAAGHMTQADVIDVMVEVDRQTGSVIDEAVWCSHHPDAPDPAMRDCWCRKPRPAMPLRGVEQLSGTHHEIYPPGLALFVGDRLEDDKRCAEALGVRFLPAGRWRGDA